MRPRARSAPTAEHARSPLWRWPLLSAAASVPLAVALGRIQSTGVPGGSLVGDVESARALFQVTATSVMTATTLTFSVTLLTLQMASQQFSPRLLREFTRDPITKAVLSVLSAAFLFPSAALVVLDTNEPAPALSMVTTFLLGATSLVAILAFITHMFRMVRVDTMMLRVHQDTTHAIDLFYPPYGEESPDLPEGALAGIPTTVTADRSGFVQAIEVRDLVDAARSRHAFVRVDVRPGDHIVLGTPVASVWNSADMATEVRAAIVCGYERTMDQDAAFGFRQLEDIAVKAMSPSVNDPVTAAHAVGHMAALLVRLTSCRLGPTVHLDDEGTQRALVPDRDLRYYLDLMCGQLQRFGSEEPTVIGAILRALRDVATACRDDGQRDEVRRSVSLTLSAAGPLSPHDREHLEMLAGQVEHALAGRIDRAYADRSGETRSM
jgi:uncharacterized membrane protein